MLETTKDIWYLVLSISVGLLAVFLCIFLGYWIALIRKVNRAINAVTNKFEQVQQTIKNSLGHFGLIAEGAKMIVEYFLAKRNESVTTEKTKKKK